MYEVLESCPFFTYMPLVAVFVTIIAGIGALLYSWDSNTEQNVIKQRINANFEEVSKCLNYSELRKFVCEGRGLAIDEFEVFEDSSLTRNEKLKLLLKRIGYSKFLECLQRANHHLGHVHICHLLNGTTYTSDELAYSKAVEKAVHNNFSTFIHGLNLSQLMSHMFQRELLTTSEFEWYQNNIQVPTDEQHLSLFATLGRKGPLAYGRFAQCLENEYNHITHRELYSLICEEAESVTTLSKRTPHQLRLHGVFTHDIFKSLVVQFQGYQYRGEWEQLEGLARQCMGMESYEIQTAALLEMTASYIFQGKSEQALDLISEAKQTCRLVSGDNSTFLDARCEYTLSELYRYQKHYDKAKEHVDNARKILFLAEEGHDRAFTSYCYATVLMEGDIASDEDAKIFLAAAISSADGCSTASDLVKPHSYMKLAQLHLGSNHYSSGYGTRDSVNIHAAESCLELVELELLSHRAKCHFYLVKSDLYRSKGMPMEADRVAHDVLEEATKYNFATVIEAAKNRRLNLETELYYRIRVH